MRKNHWLLWSALTVVLGLVGCECGGTSTHPGDGDAGLVPGQDGGGLDGGGGHPVEPDGGLSGNLPDGGTSGIALNGGPGSFCVVAGAECERARGAACCTGVCGVDGRCPEPNILCRAAGETCQSGQECCDNSCLGGRCASTLCQDVGGACSHPEQCCTKTCSNGTCAALAETLPACEVLGQGCSSQDECCSRNCQNGVCVRGWTCKASGDLCTRNTECCSHFCSASDGGLGRCLSLSGGEPCNPDGTPCSGGGSGCCSRTCVDPGYGATVCQSVSGCKQTGNFCTRDAVCCGSIAPSNITCSESRCDNGQNCNGTGNVCGAGRLPDGGVLLVNASQNCCEGQKDVCKVDSSGVPRCFGGGSAQCPNGYDSRNAQCCIPTGTRCQFSDQCCSGSLCLPDPSGNLSCQLPAPDPGRDGGTAAACQPRQGLCTTSADCCMGLRCEVPQESTVGSCQPGSACSSSGQACSPVGPCCAGLSCRDALGGTCDGTSACTCRVVIPQ